MPLKTDSPFETDPPAFLLKNLKARALEKHEYALDGQLLEQQHYLGDCPSGRQLLQVVEYQGHWGGAIGLGSRLLEANQPIDSHRVVQNRRFLMLYGFCPVIAKTFTDIEQFEGTCYKATNWKPLALTKDRCWGFALARLPPKGRHQRA